MQKTDDSLLFYEDIVRRKAKSNGKDQKSSGTVGIVTKTWDEEKQSVYPELTRPFVKVSWFKIPSALTSAAQNASTKKLEKIEILAETELEILDRAILPGDIVTTGQYHHRQSATVLETQQSLQLLHFLGDNDKGVAKVVEERFSQAQVERACPFDEGMVIVYGNWIGMITKVVHKPRVLFPDAVGSICEPLNSDRLIPTHEEDEDDDEDEEYYFSETVNGPGTVVSSKASNFVKGRWLRGEPPTVSSKNQELTGVICGFQASSLKIKWMIFNPCASDKEDQEMPPTHLKSAEEIAQVKVFKRFSFTKLQLGSFVRLKDPSHFKLATLDDDPEFKELLNVFLIVDIKTSARIEWQDSKVAGPISSRDLLAVRDINSYEFSPSDFVTKKNRKGQKETIGIVQKVDPVQRTCIVKWVNPENMLVFEEKDEPAEELSIYEIEDHADYQFRISQIVVRRNGEGPWAGEIVSVSVEGKITVAWIDQSVSIVTANDIIIVDVEDDEDEGDEYDEEDIDSDGWVDVEDEADETDVEEVEEDDQVEVNNAEQFEGSPIFQSQREVVISSPEGMENDFDFMKKTDESDFLSMQGCPIDQFEIMEVTPIEHCYNSDNSNKALANSNTKFMSAIRKEYTVLTSSLPKQIYARAFEDRLDLFRFLIIGPDCTPYENCMFLLDVKVENDYPNSPPSVFYHCMTNGMGQLNPNLYEDGHICLSLLGTWKGRDTERWKSDESNLLQLMVSIQGLVLVREPFYNEAGYERFLDSEEGLVNSIRYSENAFLLSVQSIAQIIKFPPRPFEAFIKYYYFDQGYLETVVKRINRLEKASLENVGGDDMTQWYEEDHQKFPLKRLSKGCIKLLGPIRDQLQSYLASVH